MGRAHNLLLLLAALSGVHWVESEKTFYYKDLGLYKRTGEKFASVEFPSARDIRRCKTSEGEGECLEWDNGSGQRSTFKVGNDINSCNTFQVQAASDQTARNCWDMSTNHWYGAGEEKHQYWPLEKSGPLSKPMMPVELNSRAVVDALIYNSAGELIFIDKGAPIFLHMNTTDSPNQICIVGSLEPPYRNRSSLQYTIHYCELGNPKSAFQYAVENFISKPSAYPDERMISYPIWSTWAMYAKDINDSIVREFAADIQKYGFENSQLEIDDRWQTCYGSATFDKTRFPDMKNLTDHLHNLGFRVTLWTHPFINLECTSTIDTPLNDGFLVANMEGSTHTTWWDGNASIVDFTKTGGSEWWAQQHRTMMQENGIDGLKFDAGETSWMPQLPQLNVTASPTENYPGIFTEAYVSTCATFGGISEFRSAYYTQHLPIFLRMLDKDSLWGYDNGIKTVVTTLLQFNAIGYPLVLPDMIGGNAYNGDVVTEELFVRWVQVNTFMPAMQFSVVPWNIGSDMTSVTLAKKFAQLHYQYSGAIIAAMQQSVLDGTPVNPPVWWLSPDNEDAHTIDSEFLLGENILVAPVLDQNAVQRDVFIPNGTWVDQNTMKTYTGPTWIRNYPAPLDTLPYFLRQGYTPPSPWTPSQSAASRAVLSLSALLSVLLLFR